MNAEGHNNQVETEIMTKMMQIENKRFYIDVKKNERGKFVKIAEILLSGWKSRVSFSMSASKEVLNCLNELESIYNDLAPFDASSVKKPQGNLIKSFNINNDNRRYYIDLRENQRGRFLRMAMVREQPWSMTNRSQISLNANSIKEFHDTIQELVESCKEAGDDYEVQLPKSQSFRAMRKIFYVDVTANFRGIFALVSELIGEYRMSIAIGFNHWITFADILQKFEKEATSADQLPISQHLRADKKSFYFDCDSNNRGIYLRISEVRSQFRTAITLPQETWSEFRQILISMHSQVKEAVDKKKQLAGTN